MEKYLFYLSWPEEKSEAELGELVSSLRAGFVSSLNEVSRLTNTNFSVSVGLVDGVIVLEWLKPSKVSRPNFERMLNEGGKELKKRLGCDFSWANQG